MLERTPQYLAEKAASKIALFCRGIHYILIQLPWNFRIVWCRSFCLMPCGVFILRCWPTGIHFSIVALRWHLYDQRTYKSAWVCKSIFYRFRCLRTKKAARNQNGEISWKQWKLWPNIWRNLQSQWSVRVEGMICSKRLDSLETHSNKLRLERWPIRFRDGKANALFRPIKLKSNTTMKVFHESWQLMRHT